MYHLAASKLSAEERGLVAAAQNLTMGSAARRLMHQGSGNGACPFCGALESGIIHEAWVCTGLTKHQDAADAFLNALRPGVVSLHLLLGVPEQLSIAYDDQLFQSLGTSINAADTPELVSKATLSREAQDMLVQWWGEDPDFTATTLAYRVKCEKQGVEIKTCDHVDAAAQARITTYTDGSVRHPQSIFSIATFGLFIPDCDPETIPKAMLDYTNVLDIGELPGKAGTALGGTLGGLFHSSARAELAGLATGLLAPTAVHIGLDNMGVTQKIATILDGSVS